MKINFGVALDLDRGIPFFKMQRDSSGKVGKQHRDRSVDTDCFLSYASADRAIASQVYKLLESAGITVWFDRAQLGEGVDWRREIERACESSRIVIPILTPNWRLSEWTRYETYGAALVIPLLAEGEFEATAPPPLRRWQAARLDNLQGLITAIRAHLDTPNPGETAAESKAARVAHLRYRPAAHFVGRHDLLTSLHERLFAHTGAALTQRGSVQAITAMGGIGKTTLARQYAEVFWRCYRQMFWVDCREGMEAGFARVHDHLRPNPAFREMSVAERASWALNELSQTVARPLRLLILDNAEDEDEVADWIPKTGHCHTIITSRFTGWSQGIETCPVWLLPKEPALELLLKRAGREATAPAPEQEAATRVAERLGYLPLALEQAAAYVGARADFSFDDYLRMYEASEHKFLQRKERGATDYPDSVYLTWHATMQRLSAGAKDLLQLHAFLAPTPFPVSMYVKGAEFVAPGSGLVEEYEIREWVQELIVYSIARDSGQDSIQVHALVQSVVRHALGDGHAQTPIFRRIADLFLKASPNPEIHKDSFLAWHLLTPHAQKLCNSEALPDLTLARLQSGFAQAQEYAGKLTSAIALRRAATPVLEAHLGADHRETLAATNNLALSLNHEGRVGEAEVLLRLVFQARERTLGRDDPETLTAAANLGSVLDAKGNIDEAGALHRQVVEAAQCALGPEDPKTLLFLQYLASWQCSRGNLVEAEALSIGILETTRRLRGPNHTDTIGALFTLGDVLSAKGHYREAEQLRQLAWQTSIRVYGEEHPNTLNAKGSVACELQNLGLYLEAEAHYREILEESKRLLGPDHASTLQSAANLADLFKLCGKHTHAEPLLRGVLETRERVLGESHPLTLDSVGAMAALLHGMGDYAGAEPLYQRALREKRRILGPSHPATLTATNNYAELLLSKGDDAEAQALFEECLQARQRVLGPQHLATLRSLENLANVFGRKGDFEAGEQLIRQVVAGRQETIGPEHPLTLSAIGNLSEVVYARGDYPEAEKLRRQVLELQERRLGDQHPDTLTSIADLAAILSRKGEGEAAIVLSKRLIAGRERSLGLHHPATFSAWNTLGEALYSHGDLEQAEAMFRKAADAREHVLGPDHLETLASKNNVALALSSRDEFATAEALQRGILDAQTFARGAGHPATQTVRNNLAITLAGAGKLPEARELLEQSFLFSTKLLGPEHPETLTVSANLAGILARSGEMKLAVARLWSTLQSMNRVLGAAHPQSLAGAKALAEGLCETGEFVEAASIIRQALATCEVHHGLDAEPTLVFLNLLFLLCFHQEEWLEAARLGRRLLDSRVRALGPEHPETARTLLRLSRTVMAYGDNVDQAFGLCKQAAELGEKVLGKESPEVLHCWSDLGRLYLLKKDFEQAEEWLHRAWSGCCKVFGPNHPNTQYVKSDLEPVARYLAKNAQKR